ncbi:MAG TPA: Ku protein, partial [Gaiellaceae bacterium]|nr:Ku protein [Gaiellaceae bacterium]
MAPEPVWSGTIAFGRWPLEVRLYGVDEERGSRFHLVDRRDLTPAAEGVPAEEVVRALEVEQGRYVPLERGDLDLLDVELAHAIELRGFARPDEIDPVQLRQAYYLV